MLCYTIPCCTLLYDTLQKDTALYCTAVKYSHSTLLFSTLLFPYRTVLYCTILYYPLHTALLHYVLFHTVLFRNVLTLSNKIHRGIHRHCLHCVTQNLFLRIIERSENEVLVQGTSCTGGLYIHSKYGEFVQCFCVVYVIYLDYQINL